MIAISDGFDGGNIKALDPADPKRIRLEIKKDENAEFFQWFYFRATGVKGVDATYAIENAGQASYPDGWKDYKVAASYDLKEWFRIPDTRLDQNALLFSLKAQSNSVYFAYFAPYTMVRHQNLIASTTASPLVEYERLGATLDGQDMDLLKIEKPDAAKSPKKPCWIIARQHPGETMAEWFMEGMLERILSPSYPVARELLEKVVFYVVPNMNPDGSRRGHLRTNAAGANLNREWESPSMERSPEVFLVRQKMKATGVDFCLDVHGDEGLPYNFIAGAEGIPKWTDRLAKLQESYQSALVRANPDFQTTHGYDIDEPGKANMTICTNYMAQAFDCLSMTLEMPFKDNADAPSERWGWSPERSKILGADSLDALNSVVGDL